MYCSVSEGEAMTSDVTALSTSSASPRATANAMRQELLRAVSVDGVSIRPPTPVVDTSISMVCRFSII